MQRLDRLENYEVKSNYDLDLHIRHGLNKRWMIMKNACVGRLTEQGFQGSKIQTKRPHMVFYIDSFPKNPTST